MFARMVIGEAIQESQVKEFERIFEGEVLADLKLTPGFKGHGLLIEDGGNMVISLTTWQTREDCLRFHSSRVYRQFVAKTQHLLVGSFVVKLFRTAGGAQ